MKKGMCLGALSLTAVIVAVGCGKQQDLPEAEPEIEDNEIEIEASIDVNEGLQLNWDNYKAAEDYTEEKEEKFTRLTKSPINEYTLGSAIDGIFPFKDYKINYSEPDIEYYDRYGFFDGTGCIVLDGKFDWCGVPVGCGNDFWEMRQNDRSVCYYSKDGNGLIEVENMGSQVCNPPGLLVVCDVHNELYADNTHLIKKDLLSVYDTAGNLVLEPTEVNIDTVIPDLYYYEDSWDGANSATTLVDFVDNKYLVYAYYTMDADCYVQKLFVFDVTMNMLVQQDLELPATVGSRSIAEDPFFRGEEHRNVEDTNGVSRNQEIINGFALEEYDNRYTILSDADTGEEIFVKKIVDYSLGEE